MIVANDKTEMKNLDKHRAYLITDDIYYNQAESKSEIAIGIADFLESREPSKSLRINKD